MSHASGNDPHTSQPALTAGPALPDAIRDGGAIILVHGRGATAQSIMDLYPLLDAPRLHAIAPQAAGNTWYPRPFMEPIPTNQPHLDSALGRLKRLVDDLLEQGMPGTRIAILGFSQGACLSSEFVAHNPRRYAAVMALTGGVIGPPDTPRDYTGSLAGTPVLLACGDPDPHIPFSRVRETEVVLQRLGAAVEVRRYPGRPHTVTQDEIEICRAMLQRMLNDQP